MHKQRPYILVVNKSADRKSAEILLYGYIGGDEVVAADFVRELRELEKEYNLINIRINSGGGSIFDGFTMFNAIRNAKVDIDIYIDGMAASMATVIALAGRKCYMSKVARFMTHRASGFAYGNADDLRQCAELMEGLEDDIAGIYAARTGMSIEEAKAKYLTTGKDRWVSAKDALKEKLIDGIYDGDVTEPVSPENATEKEMWRAYEQVVTPQNFLSTDNTLYVL